MSESQTAAEDAQTATVSETKFNATATLTVMAADKRAAKFAARKYFRDTHGSDPSKVIVEKSDHDLFHDGDETRFEVMVSDHSSGSLADSETYDF